VDAAGNAQVDSLATFQWTVDTVPPTATFVDPPASFSNDTSPSIEIGGTQVVSYEWSLDGGTVFVVDEVDTPLEFTFPPASDGAHTLRLWGVDAAGNKQTVPTVHQWRLDTVPPTVTLSGNPTGTTLSDQATITVSGAGVDSYKWWLNDGTVSGAIPVATDSTLTVLSDGLQTLTVVGIDTAGNQHPTGTTVQWTVDTTPPEIVTLAPEESVPLHTYSETIRVTLTEDIDSDVLTDGDIVVDSVSVVGNIMTLNLTDSLSVGADQTIELLFADLVGNTSFVTLTYDIIDQQTALFVDDDFDGTGTWANPFGDIQAAVDAATEGQVIYVAEGTYSAVLLDNGTYEIYGGYDFFFDARDTVGTPSVIDDQRTNNQTASSNTPMAAVTCGGSFPYASGIFDGFTG
ncbi:MAG: hypothetical protein KC561_20050, partial [Myxococcales bacterium]|nr:hypothetical protein [Myxococcales bacterium]